MASYGFIFLGIKDIVNDNNTLGVIKYRIRHEINNLNVNNEAISGAIINIRRRYQSCIHDDDGHIEDPQAT